MRNVVAGAALLAALAVPAHASAWGFEAHKFITRRALELLPPDLKRFYDARREEVVLRATDPDLWRNVGWNEDPNHFLDFGAKEYGVYPFTALPRELGAAAEKFGMSTLQRNGMLPWRAAEMFGNLRRSFEAFARSQFGSSEAVLFGGALAHYVQDAHQPLHATINYDGQLTGNTGIHSRFERDLFERFQSRLTITPAPSKPLTNPRDAVFDALLASYQLVDPILAADTDAAAGKDTYDDDYFEKLFVKVRPILERRLSEAISATAGALAGAWELAGRPSLESGPRPPQKVKRPQP
jgi:zinc dependent phospholipase C